MLLTIITWFLVVLFFMAGMMKVMKPYKDFKKKMAWAEDLTPKQLKKVGTIEILGAFGVILPMLLNVLTWITPLAALGLAITAFSGSALHYKRKENGSVGFSFAIGLLALYVAYSNIGLLGL